MKKPNKPYRAAMRLARKHDRPLSWICVAIIAAGSLAMVYSTIKALLNQ